MAYEMAKETQRFDSVEMHDEEFGAFLRLLASDLLDSSRDKEDKDNQKASDSRPR
jgi:hypothetical protein